MQDLVTTFRGLPNAKASFATKFVNRDPLEWDPQGRTRVRFSLMPAGMAKLVDIRTTPVGERIAAIDDFVAAGYEVHLNFSPVIVAPGWLEEWAELFDAIDAALSPAAKAQLACEVIFLTHNEQLHEVNLGWHPKAEEVLWRPDLQEVKLSQNGDRNVRYRAAADKRANLARFAALLDERLPSLRLLTRPARSRRVVASGRDVRRRTGFGRAAGSWPPDAARCARAPRVPAAGPASLALAPVAREARRAGG